MSFLSGTCSVCLLLLLPAWATGFQTYEDELSSYHHQRIVESMAEESDASCDPKAASEFDAPSDSNVVSFIQRKAQERGAKKAGSTERASHVTADDDEEKKREHDAKEVAMEGRLAKLQSQFAAFESMEEQKIAALEAQLQDRVRDMHGNSVSPRFGRLRSATSLVFGQRGEFGKMQRENATEESEVDDMYDLVIDMGGHPTLHKKLLVFGLVVLMTTLLGLAMCNRLDPNDEDDLQDLTPRDEVELRGNLSLPEDTLGFVICVWFRDTEAIVCGTSNKLMRITRIFLASAILGLNFAMQVYLTVCICTYVVPPYVSQIRDAYEEYEVHMYQNYTRPSPINGELRGIEGYFQWREFKNLNPDVKATICSSPFSQLWFFMPLLFIWTCRCAREIKNACEIWMVLVARMPNVSYLADQLQTKKEQTGATIKVIVGLTCWSKTWISGALLLPRILVSSYLCWLGARWLAAAPDLAELVLNTVALEIMVEIKDLLYAVLISSRNKRDLAHTEIRPPTRKEKASIWLFTSSTGWFVVCMGWVCFYLFYFQMVLIDFRWDTHRPCKRWLLSFPRNII
mmetsp:Transcript_97003/g.182412  ORF Transcript_97003/g.182412 Transcript_97003/m.182412 type:complete len:571 (-) Transcript_97003:14-1726(-)